MKSLFSLLACAKRSVYCPKFNFSKSDDFCVSLLTNDSRQIVFGSVFFAVKGFELNGELFIKDAIDKGALAVVVDEKSKFSLLSLNIDSVLVITTSNVRLLYSQMLRCFFPNVPKKIIGVTGTDGKSSVSHFFYNISSAYGFRVARIGSLGFMSTSRELNSLINSKFDVGLNNTQDANIIHEILSLCYDYDIDTVFIESSSQGLHQHRLSGINFSAVGFTTFSEDHIEYHGNKEDYFNAKMILFDKLLSKNGIAVINRDIDEFEKIKAIANCRNAKVISYGKSKDNDLILLKSKIIAGRGIDVEFNIFDQPIACLLPFLCSFYVENLLCAIALFIFTYKCIDFDKFKSVLPKLPVVPGRAEILCHKLGSFSPIVLDYAHTPGALTTVLKDLRKNLLGKLIVVFGCGGERDSAKRSAMGAIAKKFADVVIITDDNPRFEDPKLIRKEIMTSCEKALEITPRSKAVQEAIELMKEGDILLISGMGDSKFQIFGNKKIDYNDRDSVRQYMKNYEDNKY